jgi:hypothetical protein
MPNLLNFSKSVHDQTALLLISNVNSNISAHAERRFNTPFTLLWLSSSGGKGDDFMNLI